MANADCCRREDSGLKEDRCSLRDARACASKADDGGGENWRPA